MKTLYKMLPMLSFVLMSVIVAACAYVQKNIVPVAQDLTKQYCAVPESERLLIRQQVNQAIAPNSIVVTCAPTPPTGP